MDPRRRRALLWTFLALAAGAALRLWFIHVFTQIQGDTLLYADIARNWLNHGVYGRTLPTGSDTVVPTLVRLPGYPAMLALCFALFGQQNYQAVLYLQLLMDLLSCLLIAGFVRQLCGPRAAMVALWLAALCPFTANYVAMPLTEVPSVFCVALGLYAFAALMHRPHVGWMLTLAFAWSYAALLRPDGALMAVAFCPAIVLYGRATYGFKHSLRLALVCGSLSLLPFFAWTARNWATFHIFQPLAPRSATDPGEPTEKGFQQWTRTWLADFASTYEIYWNVPGDPIDPQLLPLRAYDLPHDVETKKLIAEYNKEDSTDARVRQALCRIGGAPHQGSSLAVLRRSAAAASG